MVKKKEAGQPFAEYAIEGSNEKKTRRMWMPIGIILGLGLLVSLLIVRFNSGSSGKVCNNVDANGATTWFKGHNFTDEERDRRQVSLFGTLEPCPELGPALQHFSPDGFQHLMYHPQCLPQIKPKLTLFTRTHTEGCLLTHQDPTTQSFSTQGPCLQTLQNLPKVVFLVHGFTLLDKSLEEYTDMKTNILNHEDIAVVIVDWIEGSSMSLWKTSQTLLQRPSNTIMDLPIQAAQLIHDLANLEPYHQAAANTRSIGAALARVAEDIQATNSTIPYTHCIGHSLGAHACGFMGKALKQISELPLDRITGLDPAGPLFLQSDFASKSLLGAGATHLTKDDAIFVDTIHTDSTWLGSFEKTGDLDFYVGSHQENEDKFGYEQKGVICFSGSHSWSKKLFMSTIGEDCNLGEVCSRIGENITQGCQDTEGLMFGYNVGAVQNNPTLTAVPVDATNLINCAGGKRITIPGKINESGIGQLMRSGAGLLCDFIKLVSPLRNMIDQYHTIFKSKTDRIEDMKRTIDSSLEDLLVLASDLPDRERKLAETHGDLRKIDSLYREEKEQLKQLATTTKRTTKRVIQVVDKISNPNITTNGADIRRLVKQVKILLEVSMRKLPEAKKKLEEISNKYGTILDTLKASSAKVVEMLEEHAKAKESIQKTRAGISAKVGTRGDIAQKWLGYLALTVGIVVSAATAGADGGAGVVVGIQAIGAGGMAAYLQNIEERSEAEQLKMLDDTLKFLERKRQDISSYDTDLGNAKNEINEKLKDIDKRMEVLVRWQEQVEYMWENYSMDDFDELETMLRGGQEDDLQDIREDFQALHNITVGYLSMTSTTTTSTISTISTTMTP
jgi:hypothetical protein